MYSFKKIFKSKYFGYVISTLFVILTIYILFKLFISYKEGMETETKTNSEKLQNVLTKIQELGMDKFKQLSQSMPSEIEEILKHEDITIQELAMTLKDGVTGEFSELLKKNTGATVNTGPISKGEVVNTTAVQ
tara:strand:- start:1211 stop:1609 length:399 start_codon:yes stop_codon:yes gene_type:complete